MHNLGTVFKFEIIRTLKKKSFWITALALPVAIAATMTVATLSTQSSEKTADNLKNANFSLMITDNSGLLNQELIKSANATVPSTMEEGLDAVKNGSVDAYVIYPSNLTEGKVQVYAKDVGLFDNGKYEAVAVGILEKAVNSSVDTNTAAVLRGKVASDLTTYRNGQVYDGIKEAVVPAMLLVLFFFLITMFGNQMLTSTTEEKENRVIEMILTTVKATTLIVGKVLSLVVLAVIQALIFIVPITIGYLLFHEQLDMPLINLSDLAFDPVRITVGLAIFTISLILFTGILVTIGAASPTAKEASSYMGVVMLVLFAPLCASITLVAAPESVLSQALTYFPLTAPIPALLRNAAGSLTALDTVIVLSTTSIATVLAVWMAVRVFKTGAIEYSHNMFRSLFKKSK